MRGRPAATVLTALAVVVGGCSGGSADSVTTTEPAAFPTAVVREWLDAVNAGDLAGIARSVEETGAAIIIAAENGYALEELAALLDGGVSEGVASSYWATFAESFKEFRGVELSSLEVGDFTELGSLSADFAAVEVFGREGSSEVLARRDETSGRWQVDMVATFGPALVRALRATLDDAEDDSTGRLVRSGYSQVVIPGLEAAMALDREDTLVQSQLAAMRTLIGG